MPTLITNPFQAKKDDVTPYFDATTTTFANGATILGGYYYNEAGDLVYGVGNTEFQFYLQFSETVSPAYNVSLGKANNRLYFSWDMGNYTGSSLNTSPYLIANQTITLSNTSSIGSNLEGYYSGNVFYLNGHSKYAPNGAVIERGVWLPGVTYRFWWANNQFWDNGGNFLRGQNTANIYQVTMEYNNTKPYITSTYPANNDTVNTLQPSISIVFNDSIFFGNNTTYNLSTGAGTISVRSGSNVGTVATTYSSINTNNPTYWYYSNTNYTGSYDTLNLVLTAPLPGAANIYVTIPAGTIRSRNYNFKTGQYSNNDYLEFHFKTPVSINVYTLVVGGGGGATYGGGGGGYTSARNQQYVITAGDYISVDGVGYGGANGPSTGTSRIHGSNGQTTSVSGVLGGLPFSDSAAGGGGGGGYGIDDTNAQGQSSPGGGGGGAGYNPSSSYSGYNIQTGTYQTGLLPGGPGYLSGGQGFPVGTGVGYGPYGGGGGGFSQAGGSGYIAGSNGNTWGIGGLGLYWIDGVYYGSGGGGIGSHDGAIFAYGQGGVRGGAGTRGVVKIAYASATPLFTGGTITTFTYQTKTHQCHTFTANGGVLTY